MGVKLAAAEAAELARLRAVRPFWLGRLLAWRFACRLHAPLAFARKVPLSADRTFAEMDAGRRR